MGSMKLAAASIAAVAAAFLAGAVSAAPAARIVTFRTPSGNIGCVYAPAEPGFGASLRCDIRSGLRPKPARPRKCDLDYGDSYELFRTGRPIATCHGDTALDPHARVLRYGTTWTTNGFVCVSRAIGLRCSNLTGHGFFLSRRHSYRF
jgi:uncharacterized protein DUF6636